MIKFKYSPSSSRIGMIIMTRDILDGETILVDEGSPIMERQFYRVGDIITRVWANKTDLSRRINSTWNIHQLTSLELRREGRVI